jgi:NADH:ubiquinone oxidoreductase subunit 3 (subunit A)
MSIYSISFFYNASFFIFILFYGFIYEIKNKALDI